VALPFVQLTDAQVHTELVASANDGFIHVAGFVPKNPLQQNGNYICYLL
jgi:hypothetical protein